MTLHAPVALVTIALCASWIPQTTTPAPTPGVLSVVLYDYAGVERQALDEAKLTTEGIYRDIGVQVAWIEVAQSVFAGLSRPHQNLEAAIASGALVVNLLSPTMEHRRAAPEGVLGLAVPQTGSAWILPSRIATLSHRYKEHRGRLLGAVIAHEIGHLVLPRHEHSVGGLMQATFELGTHDPGTLRFDLGQGDMIRSRITLGLAQRAGAAQGARF